MKNRFWDRLLIFLYVLLTIALVALTAMRAFGIDLIGTFYENLESQAPDILWKLAVSGIGAILALLGIFVILSILPARVKRRDFITLMGDENGQVKIALPALHEMVKQAVGNAAGLRDMAVDITEEGDAITVGIFLDIASGTHVPTVTMNMQRDVRDYIQRNCGVAVKDVSVVISSVLPSTGEVAEPPEAFEPALVEAPAFSEEAAIAEEVEPPAFEAAQPDEGDAPVMELEDTVAEEIEE
ncbi:MAG: alkaline shock response membrane anchor protein AmaP [Christensenellales bacterium]|jgi:uncharacterized alkaline shock family protein YloU